MSKEEFYYPSVDTQTQIHAVLWLPEEDPKAVIQIAHGITEHMGRYEDTAAFLTEYGFAVAGNDHLGHGLSVKDEDARLCCSDWNYLAEDAFQLSVLMRERFPDLPYYGLGFSLGSFVMRTLMSWHPEAFDKMILIGTGFQPSYQLKIARHIVQRECNKIGENGKSEFIENLAFGSYNKNFEPNRTKCDWLSANESVVDAYLADPLCDTRISAGLFRELLNGMLLTSQKDMQKNIRKDMPIYLMSGKNDPVGEMGKGIDKYQKVLLKVGVKFVSAVNYTGERHDILRGNSDKLIRKSILSYLSN